MTQKFDMQAMRDKIKAKTTEITKATDAPATPPAAAAKPATPSPADTPKPMSPAEKAKAAIAAGKAKREAEAAAEEAALLAAEAEEAEAEAETSLEGVDTTPINSPGEYQTEAEGVANEAAEKEAKVEAKAAKKGPGRPRKPAAAPEEVTPSDFQQGRFVGQDQQAAKAAAPSFILCIDVTAFGVVAGNIILGEELFGAVDEVFKDTHGHADYRYVDYGKGAGLWQECLRQIIDSGALNGRVLVVSSVCAETSIALAELAPRAHTVFRSMK